MWIVFTNHQVCEETLPLFMNIIAVCENPRLALIDINEVDGLL
jgi:hypothetical protein